MKLLEYPFDADELVSKKKKLRRELLASGTDFIDKKIAILGGFTTALVREMLELFLLGHGIRPSFYESEYNQYYQDGMFPNSELEAFAPDLVYICTSNRNITAYPELSDGRERVMEMLRAEMERFTALWDRIASVYACPILQNNFDYPYVRLLGNRDAVDFHGRTYYVNWLNQHFAEYAAEHSNFHLCDLNYISADYGLKEWADPYYYHLYKYAVSVPAIPYLSFQVANIVKSLYGKNKKGFVVDLDNTLWGGFVGDDGPGGLAVGPEESEGQAYLEFQNYLKAHKDLGILLNVDSKNDEENALAGLRHPGCALHPEDFTVIRANWEPKDRNFAEIARELNLLPESLVFLDDNPAEREIVTAQLPGVSAPPMDRIDRNIGILGRSGFFEVTSLSEDDRKRGEMYRENVQRSRLEASFENYRDYLLSLAMRAQIRPFEEDYLARIAQLTNKSNQFNLTTRRYTQTEIEAIAKDPARITLSGKLEDRFGDNGVVSVVIGRVDGEECHIELWLMSCRVLKRDMEFAMMDALAKRCVERGVQRIYGYYYPTAKNKMVQDFYALQGFRLLTDAQTDGAGERKDTVWELDLAAGYENRNSVIEVEE